MKTIALMFFAFCLMSFSILSYNTKTDIQKLNYQNPQIDRIVYDEMIKQNLPGVAVGVIKDGRIVHYQGYGYTDIEKKTKVTQNTIFRWASISKPLTAIATLQLAEEGNLNVDDKVNKHLTGYWPKNNSDRKSKITIEHLLMNRSGINHYGDGVTKEDAYKYYEDKYKPDSDDYNERLAVAVFRDAKLDFAPGDKYLYSTFGFNLLGSVVEEASPDGYVDWVKTKIAGEAGMTSLKVAKTKRTGYQKRCDGQLAPHPISSQEWKLPGGGWESNILDLTRFAQGIIRGSFLNNTSKLWENKSAGSKFYHYGINKNGSGNNMKVWHGGSHNNLRTLMHVYPNRKEGIVIMCYAEYADCWRILDRIYNNVLDISRSSDTSPVDKCTSKMESCNGKFASIWRKTGKDVIIRRGYSHKAFLNEWQFLKTRGYYCDDFDAYTEKGKLKWDGIFRKGNKKTAMWRNFDKTGFKNKWKEQTTKGFRLVDLETYVVKGKRKWAGLFIEGGGKHAMFRDLNHDSFKQKREEMKKEGRKLIDIEVYEKNGKLYWSGVWRQGTEGLVNRNYSTSDFNKLWKEREKSGYKLVDIEAYKFKGQLKWAGVWEKSSKKEKLNRGFNFCGLMDKHEEYSKDGYELLDLERY